MKIYNILFTHFVCSESYFNIPNTIHRVRTFDSDLNDIPFSKSNELSIDTIYGSWNTIQYGQNGVIGIENVNKYLDENTFSVPMSRVGGLGLNLVELKTSGNRQGLVVISDILPGMNADKTKKFKVGDTLISISSATKTDMVSMLEGRNFDTTVEEINRFSGEDTVVITARRLVYRQNVVVRIYNPKGIHTRHKRTFTLAAWITRNCTSASVHQRGISNKTCNVLFIYLLYFIMLLRCYRIAFLT